MNGWSDVYRPAMQVEEAALLPARSKSAAGRSALQDALRRAEEMGQKQLSNEVSAAGNGARPADTVKPVYLFPGSRAALHQVMRRK